MVRQRFGYLREITRPALTPFLGISLDTQDKVPNVTQSQNLLVKYVPYFLDGLPRHHRFKLNFHPDFNWWSPFFWRGFSQQSRYTYRLTDLDNLEAVWSRFNSNARRNIKKAEKQLELDFDGDVSTLYDLFSMTMENQNKKPGYPAELLKKLVAESLRRESGKVIIARAPDGEPHCALFIVWHNNECYYLVGGTHPVLRKSGAMMLSMWGAIQYAANHAAVFDFEGSMQPGIDKFLRNFGGIPVGYSQITGSHKLF